MRLCFILLRKASASHDQAGLAGDVGVDDVRGVREGVGVEDVTECLGPLVLELLDVDLAVLQQGIQDIGLEEPVLPQLGREVGIHATLVLHELLD